MISKRAFPVVFNFLMSLFVAVLMAIVVNVLANQGLSALNFESFLRGFIQNLAVGFLIGALIPLNIISDAFAYKLGAKSKKTFGFNVLKILCISVIMVLLMSLILLFLDMGFMADFWSIWSKMVPILLGVVFVFLMITMPIIGGLSAKIASKD